MHDNRAFTSCFWEWDGDVMAVPSTFLVSGIIWACCSGCHEGQQASSSTYVQDMVPYKPRR